MLPDLAEDGSHVKCCQGS